MNGMNNGMGAGGGQPMGQPMGGMMAAAAVQSVGPKAVGVLVPMVLQSPMGEVTVMVQFGEAEAQNVPGLVMQLLQMGWPVKAYQPKQPFNGGGGGNGYQGGGYQNNGWRPRRW